MKFDFDFIPEPEAPQSKKGGKNDKKNWFVSRHFCFLTYLSGLWVAEKMDDVTLVNGKSKYLRYQPPINTIPRIIYTQEQLGGGA